MAKFWSSIPDYRYPYCTTDVAYYTGSPVKTIAPAVDHGGSSCPANEWADENYNACTATYPGFTSPTSKTPTEAVVPDVYSQYAGTGSSISQTACPAGSSILMAGAVNDLQACRLWGVGQCAADRTAAAPAEADFC